MAHEQSVMFEKAIKAAGNSFETITVKGGRSKLNSDDTVQMIAWLKKTLK